MIYELTIGTKRYIGMTFVRERSVKKTMKARLKQHWYNAHVHKKGWALSNALRNLDCIEDINYEVLQVVRGKDLAHVIERELIIKHKPKLNTDVRKKGG